MDEIKKDKGTTDDVKTKESKAYKTEDENIWAAIAHALVIVLPVIAPLVIWAVFKDKSGYIKKQSLQALVYQVAGSVLLSILWFMTVIMSFLVVGILFIPILLLLMLVFVVYGLYAGWKCYNGQDFKYAVIGDVLDKQ